VIRDFSIRRAHPSDAPNVIALIDAVGAEGIWLATECYVPTPQWEQVLHHPDVESRGVLFLAETQEKIVGWCRIFPFQFGNKSSHVADIGIGVQKEFRGRGIGRALITNAIAWARDQGFEKLTLDLYSTSETAKHLFENVGFHVVGMRACHAKINGAYVDELFMEMKL
jgi:RimJ/RimL family protein N-acetyltransferase